MIPFDLDTLDGLTQEQKQLVLQMTKGILHTGGIAYLTVHGKKLETGQTLRRPGPHTDGNYEPVAMPFGRGGGNGWKVGENGPGIYTDTHARQYNTQKGGIIMASNIPACRGWVGEYNTLPNVGGDCSHIKLNEGFDLKPNKVYYGNNHFIHESLPVSGKCHRVFVRITLPETHNYSTGN